MSKDSDPGATIILRAAFYTGYNRKLENLCWTINLEICMSPCYYALNALYVRHLRKRKDFNQSLSCVAVQF
jgi:hypothetical protein